MPDLKPKLTSGERLFIGGMAVVTFVVSLGFVLATVGWGQAFPGVFVAITLGICIASIVYAFLGGVAGAEFSMISGVKLAGSLGAIAIVYWLISGPLDRSMNDAKAIATGKLAAAKIALERNNLVLERAARVRAEQRVQELESQAGIDLSDSSAAMLARIRQSTADDELGRGVIAIHRDRQGPFRIQTFKIQSRLIQNVPIGNFHFCHGKRPELKGKTVQFEVVDADTGVSKKISLKAGADIGPGACELIKFDVHLGCDAAKELLQLTCDERRGVAWPTPNDNRIYDVVATVTPSDTD